MSQESLIKPYQIVTIEDLRSIGVLDETTYDVFTDALNKRLTFSCQLTSSNPPDANINLGAMRVLCEDSRTLRLTPLNGVLQDFVGGTIDPINNTFTGNINPFTYPTATAAGQYIRMVVHIDATGFINLSSTQPGPSLGGSGAPPFLGAMIP